MTAAEAATSKRNHSTAPLKSCARIIEFRLGKGITRKIAGSEADFNKKYLELTVRLPEQYTEEDFQGDLTRAEYIIDSRLEQAETPETSIPEFNPEELMEHPWKGKKDRKGGYLKGSVAWGWNFRDQFSEEVLKALEKGPIEIDQYEFTLGETFVQAKKKKK